LILTPPACAPDNQVTSDTFWPCYESNPSDVNCVSMISCYKDKNSASCRAITFKNRDAFCKAECKSHECEWYKSDASSISTVTVIIIVILVIIIFVGIIDSIIYCCYQRYRIYTSYSYETQTQNLPPHGYIPPSPPSQTY
jgi:hypothetical protein